MQRTVEKPFYSGLAASRRQFLEHVSGATLSAGAIALLAGLPGFAQANHAREEEHQSDIAILNAAIGAEHQAIAAYQAGAESGLLEQPVLAVAVSFQGHHKEHVELLSETVKKLGGVPSHPLADYRFPLDRLNSQKDVLEFAAGLERGAVTAYAGAIPAFESRDLAQAAASILSDEAMHWAVLRNALGLEPVPGAFFS